MKHISEDTISTASVEASFPDIKKHFQSIYSSSHLWSMFQGLYGGEINLDLLQN